jgi:hypothetical protein
MKHRRALGLSAVDADDVPFLGDAGAPEFLGAVGLAGGEEEGGHER